MDSTRTRTSRWASPTSNVTQLPIIDGDGTLLPSAIQANMTAEQLEAYVVHFRIQEITNQLRLPDAALLTQTQAQRRRERSPEPEYDAVGRRTNTHLQRHRQALEAERHRCVEEAMAKIPSYKPPFDYRRPIRFTDRVYIPQGDFPSLNFIGQILGPRGASLKSLQEKADAVIVIRGKGSVKEGRGRQRARTGTSDDSNQPLHVVITADTQARVEEGKRLIQKVIDDAVTTPERENERKKKQLQDLAIMNGTFRDDEGRFFEQRQNQIGGVTSSIEGASSSDLQTTRSYLGGSTDVDLDKELAQLMEDVEGCPRGSTDGRQQEARPLPPWRVECLQRGSGFGRY